MDAEYTEEGWMPNAPSKDECRMPLLLNEAGSSLGDAITLVLLSYLSILLTASYMDPKP